MLTRINIRSSAFSLWSKTIVRNRWAYSQRLHDKPLLYRSIGEQIQRAADIYAERPAFVSCHEEKKLTFAQAKREAENFAVQLAQLGLKQGDHIGIWAPNTIQWYITFMAAALGGFPLICINPLFQAQELSYALKKAKVKAVVTMDKIDNRQHFSKILNTIFSTRGSSDAIDDENFPDLKYLIVQGGKKEVGFVDYDQLLGREVTAEERVKLNEYVVPSIKPEDACNIQFTSGTTGRPKAALLNHINHVNMGYIMGPNIGVKENNTRICLTVPLFHAFGMGVNMCALHYGAAMVSPSALFSAKACLNAIEQEKCNLIIGTPTMFVDMVQLQEKLKKDLSTLEYGMFGGASCTPQVYKMTKEVLGIRCLRIGYGQSECTTATFGQTGDESPEEAVATIGIVCQHLEAKVINEKGETVRCGEIGQLCIRGYCTMMEYFEDEESTAKTKTLDGWLRTGDEVIMDERGVARIMGRQKEMVIRGGENIFPKEIEELLDTHSDVLESQVIGVPDERLGEELCAFLRLKSPEKVLTVEDIREFCQGKIAAFKIPRYVRVIKEYPKTNSGKIQKFKLLDIFKNQA